MGNKVNMSFSHFSVEEPQRNNCRYDYVEIMESSLHERDTRTSLGRFCGTQVPALIASTKENVFVQFASDSSHALNGFRMEWVLNGKSKVNIQNGGGRRAMLMAAY
jgi:glutaredoxin-related protein